MGTVREKVVYFYFNITLLKYMIRARTYFPQEIHCNTKNAASTQCQSPLVQWQVWTWSPEVINRYFITNAFEFALEYDIRRDSNVMEHLNSWSMLPMLYWVKTWLPQIKTQKLCYMPLGRLSLDASTEKTKYMVISCHQNAGQIIV